MPYHSRHALPLPAALRLGGWLAVLALVACAGGGPDPSPGEDAASDQSAATGTWGWISVVETNDLREWVYVREAGWYGGVRAYFATRPSWPRALPWDLTFARVERTAGGCTLYDAGILGEGCEDCFCLDKGIECVESADRRWCGPDEICVQGPERPEDWPDRGVCQALPAHFDVGPIAIEGLTQAVSMTPDEYDRYLAPDPPPELFDADSVVTARTGGGGLAPLVFETRGVPHLEVADQAIHAAPGQPAVVRWQPADTDAGILVVLRAGSHDPYPVSGAIVCEAEDSAGQITVPADLLQRLHDLACDGAYLQKSHAIYRYRRDRKTLPDGSVELFVASARRLQLVFD